MKKLSAFTSTIMLIAILTAVSCQSNSEKVGDAKEDLQQSENNLKEANEDYQSDLENYRKEVQLKISENDKRITDFEASIANSKTEAKSYYQEKITELKAKNAKMKGKMDDYQLEGKDKWQSFKNEFNHDMDELGNSIKDLTTNDVD